MPQNKIENMGRFCLIREFMDMLPSGAMCCRRDGTLCAVNPAMLRMTGYGSFEELRAAACGNSANMVWKEDRCRVTDEATIILEKGEEFSSTYRIIKQDGSPMWIRSSSKLVNAPDGSGDILSCYTDVSMIVDVNGVAQLEILNNQLSRLNSIIPVGYRRCADTEEYDFLYISSRFLDMLGYTRREIKELFDDKFARMIHPADRRRMIDGEENHALARQPNIRYEYRIKAKSGYIWVVDNSAYMAEREPPFLHGVIMDITDRITLQEQLRTSSEAFRIAAGEAGNLVFTYSRSRQEIYCDENTARIFGVDETQPGVPYDIARRGDIISVDTAGTYVRIHEEIISGAKEASGIVKLINHPEGELVYEVRFQTILDENEQPTDLAVGVYKDITDAFFQARAQERSLKDLQEKYTTIKEEMENGRRERMSMIYALSAEYYSLWLVDLNNDILSLRRKDNVFYQDSNMPPSCYSKCLMVYAKKRVHPSDRRTVLEEGSIENIRRHLKDEQSFSIRLRRKTTAAEKFKYVEWHIVRLNTDEIQNAAIIAVKDIDGDVLAENKQQILLKNALDQAENANRAKSIFLSNMSHDIRTPMNTILGFAGIALNNIENRCKVQDCLEKILSSSGHLLSLINDILDMNQIESGKMPLQEKNCSLSERIHAVVDMIRPQMQAKKLKFVVDISGILDEELIFDPLKLDQVLINMLGNSVKFTPAGGTVTLSIQQTDDVKPGFCHYQFRISDTGIGMSQEFLEHLFEPFEREGTDSVIETEGTGLGMSIVKTTVELMGGKINVDTSPGKGSNFTIDFDFKRQEKAECEGPGITLAGLRILVVDDDFDICSGMIKMLEQNSMRADWATSGREAVYRAKKAADEGDPYYCCLIDWKMPNMDGIETTRHIRSMIRENSPLIILTAYDWAEIESEAREAGVNAFCSKPMFMSDLVGVLREAQGIPAKPAQPEPFTYDFTGKRVLVAEDNALNREVAKELLKNIGFIVETVIDGSFAVEKIKAAAEGYYDLIIMDIQMPVVDGYEATKMIRSLPRQDAARIPIIAMTANAFNDDRQRAFKYGMNGHISKPIDVDMLPVTLGRILSGISE